MSGRVLQQTLNLEKQNPILTKMVPQRVSNPLIKNINFDLEQKSEISKLNFGIVIHNNEN